MATGSDPGVVEVLVQLEHAVVPVPDDGGLLDLLEPGQHQVNNYRQRSSGISGKGAALTACHREDPDDLAPRT